MCVTRGDGEGEPRAVVGAGSWEAVDVGPGGREAVDVGPGGCEAVDVGDWDSGLVGAAVGVRVGTVCRCGF